MRRQEQFLASLHKYRFTAARRAHPCTLDRPRRPMAVTTVYIAGCSVSLLLLESVAAVRIRMGTGVNANSHCARECDILYDSIYSI